ncbi:MAG TPA: cupin domain-containing protein [Actinomycetota bacterium]|nr:cupin domain-containing protein [Actinomycetota bacterium]
MAELERVREDLEQRHVDARLYYDYEGRFVKQRLERDRMRMLPRVVKPAMFARSGHSLGDVRVFERFTVGPVSALTCRFVELDPGERTPVERRIPILLMFVLEGDGVVDVDGEQHAFGTEDVVVVPPYSRYAITAGGGGLRGWVPETRFWHVLGLLWHEHLEPRTIQGIERVDDAEGRWQGYLVPDGVLGLDGDLELPGGADPRRGGVFEARRAAPAGGSRGSTWYDDLVRQLSADNERHDRTPRVIRAADRPMEDTRGGRMRFYVSNWEDLSGQDLDLAVYEVPPGERTGTHRHIAEELLLVLQGSGVEEHDGSTHRFEAGDLICIPPMAAHARANDGDGLLRLVSVWSHHPANEFLGGFEHIADASDRGAD